MKKISPWLLILLLARVGLAQLQVVPEPRPQAVFGGMNQNIAVRFRNVGGRSLESDLRMVLFQTSTATVARSGEWPWKNLPVLPGQTVLEMAAVQFPAVQAETRFLIQWVEGASNVVGRTEVLVYPTNLLHGLKALAADNGDSLGVFDPEHQLKPLLRDQGIAFSDLEAGRVENFRGRLAIIEVIAATNQLRLGLRGQIETLARKGVAVIWVQSSSDAPGKLRPSFYSLAFSEIAVVVVQSEFVANPSENPQAQWNLLQLCRLALAPEPVQLPQPTAFP